jgi:precorrin-8X/cobalt-precorrin-8 methylmutase
MLEHTFIYNPKDIENKSFEIIAELLKGRSINPLHLPILQRVIHTTADLEYINMQSSKLNTYIQTLSQPKLSVFSQHFT